MKRTRAWRRYSQVWLYLERNPAILGGKLRATVRAATVFPSTNGLPPPCMRPPEPHQIVCVWLLGEPLAGKQGILVSNGEVQVEFDLPADLPESDPDIPNGRTWFTWDLLVSVKSTAATFSGQFSVPVFKKLNIEVLSLV